MNVNFECNPCECGGHPDCPDCNPAPQRVELTRNGRRWAKLHADDSIVARIALANESAWPHTFVATSIKIANYQGENVEPTDVEIYGAGG